MKNRIIIVSIVLTMCFLLTSLLSCSKKANESLAKEETFDGYFVKPSVSIIKMTSLEECVSNADLIIRGTVSEIGEVFLADGYEIKENMTEKEKYDLTQAIRTPYTFLVKDVYKNTSGRALGETLTFNGYHGTYNNEYRLYSLEPFESFKENSEYVLFINAKNDNYSIYYQPSFEICENEEISFLFPSTPLYKDVHDSTSAINSIKAIISEDYES